MKSSIPQLSITILLTVVFISLAAPMGRTQIMAQEVQDEIINEQELPSIFSPGRVMGEGDSFEIKDSQYLNVALKSTEKIKVVFESAPRGRKINKIYSNLS